MVRQMPRLPEENEGYKELKVAVNVLHLAVIMVQSAPQHRGQDHGIPSLLLHGLCISSHPALHCKLHSGGIETVACHLQTSSRHTHIDELTVFTYPLSGHTNQEPQASCS